MPAIAGYRRCVDAINRSSVARSRLSVSSRCRRRRRHGPSLRHRLIELIVEQGHHDGKLLGTSLLRAEDPQQRLLELGAAIEPCHAIVGERPQERVAEPGGHAFLLDVERAQVRVEVLAGHVSVVAVGIGVAPFSGDGAEVAERVEDRQPVSHEPCSICTDEPKITACRVEQLPDAAGIEVEAQHERAHALEMVEGEFERIGRRGGLQPGEIDRRPDRNVGVVAAEWFDADQRRAGVDLDVASDEDLADPSADRRRDCQLHLHRLDDRQPLPGLDDVVGRDIDTDDERRGRGAHDAGIVAGEPMGDTVDLDEMVGVLHRGHHREGAPGNRQAAPGPTEALDVDDDAGAGKVDLVPRRTDPPCVDAVGPPAVAELDFVADLHVDERATTTRPTQEHRPLPLRLQVICVDHRGDEPDLGQSGRQVLVCGGEPVEPRRVELAATNLGARQEIEQE